MWVKRFVALGSWLGVMAAGALLVAWCAACMLGPLLLVNAVDLPAEVSAPLSLVLVAGGLAFALWSCARVTGHRRM